ncbi:glutamate-1-semialdehyde 2,1-aminomutase [Pseudacidovorax intermedius]|uniref:Glutamate-1-semialdehyde 2,1-aminomutase n=1 Tax=Pseudacidovorax intermedius TaxID=433924 RepID=A0A370FE61_9BURK|nr:aminotransferase class III-fold pyridoxal phosphate-dependent enzyme [Pseudacidovorax intermedius]RDI24325.1 glutamate-1-semialdehyde 2,1-aminomutase [Pseudacidovorax intermedius]
MNDALSHALEATLARYAARNPTSARLLDEAATAMPGGNTRSVLFHPPFPLAMSRGEGCRLWDEDGHAYLDALGEFTAALYGHSNAHIRAAIADALSAGLNLSSHTAREAALAREIQRRFPGMALLRFANSGTEANLLALAVAKAHTGRGKVVVFEGAYHGGVLTFGGGPSPMNVPHDFVFARYNDLGSVQALLADHGPDVAAILVEPMLGAGGTIPGDPAFLAGLRALATEHGVQLIFDEVMTSRLSFGGRQALLDIAPDLTTAGKYLGGGLSFGVFGGRAEVMARFDPRRPDALAHAGTFNNNVLTMAAGLAGLTQVLTAEALDALNRRGDALRERLNATLADQAVDMQFTGLGSLMTLHATARPVRSPADLAGTDGRAKDLVFFALLERGIFMARRGMIALSLPFGDAECDTLAAAFEDAIRTHRDVLPRR